MTSWARSRSWRQSSLRLELSSTSKMNRPDWFADSFNLSELWRHDVERVYDVIS